MAKYRQRIADQLLARKLDVFGAVLVEGAKWCGKTTTCEQQAKSILYFDDPQEKDLNLRRAEVDIKSLLVGARPRLIDEWQHAPQLWDAIRFEVDHSDGEGHFILTGSSVLSEEKLKKISHTGTGRIVRLKMRPMSLWESGESTGTVSLGELFASADLISAEGRPLTMEELAFIICRGGWPKAVERKGESALDYAAAYLAAVIESDISRTDGVPRNPERVRLLMRSYSRLQGTQSTLAAIRRDMAANEERTLNEDTIYSYLGALKRIFVVEDMPAWCPQLRAKDSVRTTDTRYFTDPSIAAAALGASPSDLMEDLRTTGYLFESLVIRDLRVYIEALQGRIEHYHDKTGLECDAVLHLRNGKYALVEIKLGGETLVNEGLRTLNALDTLIAEKGMKPPTFKMIVVGIGDFAYRRPEDGVIVCPISCLRP